MTATVLITGSSGRLGTMLTQRLGALGWNLRLLDRVPAGDGSAGPLSVGAASVGAATGGTASEGTAPAGTATAGTATAGAAPAGTATAGAASEDTATGGTATEGTATEGTAPADTVLADLNDPAALDAALADGTVVAIVHLAGQPTEAVWETVREANIDGAYRIFEAARRAGVRRVVYASSNHAVGFTPRTTELAVDPAGRPDTLYGVSKVFGEALARYYVDRYAMTVSCLRIGTCDWTPPDHRALSTWLSPDDLTRLVDAALRTTVPYSVVWGVSANTRRWWSLEEGWAIGYRPKDDAEAFAEALMESPAFPSDDLVGGGFTTPGFGIDEVRARA